MKLGYLLAIIGMMGLLGGLANIIGSCLAGTSLFADPFTAGSTVGAFCLGFVLISIGSRRIGKEMKNKVEGK